MTSILSLCNWLYILCSEQLQLQLMLQRKLVMRNTLSSLSSRALHFQRAKPCMSFSPPSCLHDAVLCVKTYVRCIYVLLLNLYCYGHPYSVKAMVVWGGEKERGRLLLVYTSLDRILRRHKWQCNKRGLAEQRWRQLTRRRGKAARRRWRRKAWASTSVWVLPLVLYLLSIHGSDSCQVNSNFVISWYLFHSVHIMNCWGFKVVW